MRRKSLFLFPLISIVLSFSGFSSAQLWSGVLSSRRASDWSSVGTPGGVPNRTTVCATLNPGTSASQISSAISSCPSGQVVLLNGGTYNLSSGIDFGGRSNVTLRGAGADHTFLVFTGNAGCGGLTAVICLEGDSSLFGGSSGVNPSQIASWTASSYAKGQSTITLSNTTGLQVGHPLVLDQCNDGLSGSSCSGTEKDSGSVYVCNATSSACTSTDGPSGAGRPGRSEMQIVTVTDISGNTVTFTPGLYMPNWSAAKSPGAYWSTSPATSSGVEDLSIDFTNGGSQAGISIWNYYNTWVKGVRSVYATHNGAGERNHVWLVLSNHVTVRDSYFFGSASLHSEGYGVEAFGTSDDLIENNIFQNMPSPQMINGECSGCVIGYNFSINDANDSAYLFNSLTLHAPVSYLLAEGNIGNSWRADKFHGSHNFNTAFRNYYNGWETGITNGLGPYIADGIARYSNAIGNVLGRAGVQTQYQCIPSICPSGFAIYELGTALPDSFTVNTQMRWGNYDTVTSTAGFAISGVPSVFSDTSGSPSLYVNPVPSSTTLPPSFYLSAKPSWWGPMPYPAIGPDVTGGNLSGVGGHAYMIPAMACYTNVMGGPADGSSGVLTFNAITCYGQQQSGSSAPAPPTGLSAVIQ